MSYVRRIGDERPLEREPGEPLSWKPCFPVRWLPRHGPPGCKLEWFSQALVKALAYAPLYTAVIVSITLLVVLWPHW